MIREKYNLVCSNGHYHYSPTPDHWVGATCFKPFETPMAVDGRLKSTSEKCQQPLALLKRNG